jgi:CheY-like chemotaxis protein
MTTILFVDDDEFGMKPYRLALEDGGFTVLLAQDPDQAMTQLTAGASTIAAVILDVLMPSGELLKDQNVDHGLKTGLRMLSHIRELYPQLPVIIFSVTNNDDMISEEPPLIDVLRKAETMPMDLVDLVRNRIAQP